MKGLPDQRWHPCRGAIHLDREPVVSLRSTTGYKLGSRRLPLERELVPNLNMTH